MTTKTTPLQQWINAIPPVCLCCLSGSFRSAPVNGFAVLRLAPAHSGDRRFAAAVWPSMPKRRRVAHCRDVRPLPPNVAPTHEMPIIRREKGDRRCELAIAHWGLIPRGAKDANIADSTINAPSETAASEPAIRHAFKRHRCLVPADGFFAWKRDGKIHQPHLIRMKGGGVFAGLWSLWRDVTSFTIMTTEPNERMMEIDNRMPVILGKDDCDRWLDLDADPSQVLNPCPSDWLEAYPVDKRVGNVRNNDAGLIEPLR